MAKKDVIVGLDIGTTKICSVVGEISDEGFLNIIGIGTFPSKGLKKGAVVNIESTVESISNAVEEAERMAGCEITKVYTGIAGGHIKSFNSTGVVAVKEKEIVQSDVDRVIDAAKAVAIPLDREILHVIPQEFIIDDQDGIKEPVGMSGVRLESKVHVVTGAVTSAQNIVKCANRAGLNVADIVLQPIASAEAVLTQDEKELGCILIDIGGGTSDIAIFSGGSIVHTGVIAIGGNHITNDISVGLRTPYLEAEKIKVRHGCALASMVSSDETIEVPSVGGRKPRVVSRQLLAEIIEPRVEEIFNLVHRDVVESGFENLLAGGIIITGGSTILEGVTEMSEFVFDMPVKRGAPQGISGVKDVVSSPKYSTGVGLVLYGMNQQIGRTQYPIRGGGDFFDKIKSRFGHFIQGLF
jgi:cell division protein FtsA